MSNDAIIMRVLVHRRFRRIERRDGRYSIGLASLTDEHRIDWYHNGRLRDVFMEANKALDEKPRRKALIEAAREREGKQE